MSAIAMPAKPRPLSSSRSRRRPNFFIVGAPKCGTTSLALWLAEHPNIFVPPEKELHFFNTDDKRFVTSLDRYEAFFDAAEEGHLAAGEASVWYLSSQVAIANIDAYAPDAKFIVMLRNPVEMAPALHEEMVFTGNEDVIDFATAWRHQAERRQGRRLPQPCWEPRRLLYGDACRIGAQLQRLLAQVPADRVLTIVFDDFQKDPREQYLRVLDFLGVPDDGREDFPNRNPAKERRWPMLPRIANVVVDIKRRLGIDWGFGIWQRIDAANRISRTRQPLAAETIAELRGYFAGDVDLLSGLLRRDLRGWLT